MRNLSIVKCAVSQLASVLYYINIYIYVRLPGTKALSEVFKKAATGFEALLFQPHGHEH